MQLITETAILEAYLRRDAALHAYALGDLDEFFRPYTTWFADDAHDPGAVILRYEPGNASPVYHALCRPECAAAHARLFRELVAALPAAFEIHATPGVLAESPGIFGDANDSQTRAETEQRQAANRFRVQRRELHCKMILREGSRERDREVDDFIFSPARAEDLPEIEGFFANAYPENWFDPRMIATDAYLLARARDGRITGVAGVHVYSEAYRVAALGNIATHPDFRRRGIAAGLTRRLCALLRERGIDTITLNVKSRNTGAIACYESLGFEVFADYEELSVSRAPGD